MTQQEWKFSRPFRIDEQLTAVSQVSDIRDRLGGRYGYSVLLTTTTDYYDLNGGHVAAVMLTITQFDPADPLNTPRDLNVANPQVIQAMADAIAKVLAQR